MEPDHGCGSAPPGLEVGVDVGTLRQLLLEHSDRIRESGNHVLQEAMTKIQQKHEEYFVLIENKVQRLSDRCNNLASRLQMLEEGQHFAATKEDAQDNLGTGGHTVVEQDLRRTKQKNRRRGKRVVNKEDKSENEAPMISGERDVSDDLALLSVEGSESGPENSLVEVLEEAPQCDAAWGGDTAGMYQGWKPRCRRSWNRHGETGGWKRVWHRHRWDKGSWSTNHYGPGNCSTDWRKHWRSQEYPIPKMNIWVQGTGPMGQTEGGVAIDYSGEWLQLRFF